MEYKDPGKYIPIIYLLYSWGSRFGVPSTVPLIGSFPKLGVRLSGQGLGSRAVFPKLGNPCLGFRVGFRV